jgi:soluble lytic murein transglycosylase-like protein
MIGLGLAVLWGGQASTGVSPAVPAIAREEPVVAPPVSIVEEPAPPAPLGPRARSIRAQLTRLAKQTDLTPAELDALATVVESESRRFDLAAELVLAVMHVESRFRTYAVSEKNAMGLMQIMPSTGRWLAPQVGVEWRGPHTLFDPIVNVRLGIAYLHRLTKRYHGDLAAALAAYNWGPGHIDRRIARGVPLPDEYPRLVLNTWDRTTRRS